MKTPLQQHDEAIEASRKEYENDKKVWGAWLKQKQKDCKHKKEHYEGDASGNNDNWYVCDACGRER